MPKERLYFIAILPPDDIANRVQEVKKEFVEKYDSKKAYHKPPHFTLQIPFKAPESIEKVLVPNLIFFAEEQEPFPVQLSGFNHFRDDVIFIDIEDPTAMKSLHADLIEFLQNEIGFNRVKKNLTPHMTVAYRDLTPDNFKRAWTEFKDRSFNYSFQVNSIFLLKHDFNRWQPFYEFNFAEA